MSSGLVLVITGVTLIVAAALFCAIAEFVLFRRQKQIVESYEDALQAKGDG
ncbi:MAG: hypothetical protein LBP28_03070 [Coriobacteriales bacterium]|jgi:hypothetical protein|nr:hypothetical protein [Coriobacteriales bacterium]